MIPKELEKPIDEIKTPSNRILIICILLAVISLSSVIVYQYKENASNYRQIIKGLESENKRLNEYINDERKATKYNLERRERQVDSLLYLSNKLIKK